MRAIATTVLLCASETIVWRIGSWVNNPHKNKVDTLIRTFTHLTLFLITRVSPHTVLSWINWIVSPYRKIIIKKSLNKKKLITSIGPMKNVSQSFVFVAFIAIGMIMAFRYWAAIGLTKNCTFLCCFSINVFTIAIKYNIEIPAIKSRISTNLNIEFWTISKYFVCVCVCN